MIVEHMFIEIKHYSGAKTVNQPNLLSCVIFNLKPLVLLSSDEEKLTCSVSFRCTPILFGCYKSDSTSYSKKNNDADGANGNLLVGTVLLV